MLDHGLDDGVEEFRFLLRVFLGCHGATRLCNRFLNLRLHQRLCLRDDEHVGQAFFHGDGDDTSYILILNHLVQTPDVHRVEHGLDNHDLPGRFDVHRLLLLESDVSVFPGVGAIDAQ